MEHLVHIFLAVRNSDNSMRNSALKNLAIVGMTSPGMKFRYCRRCSDFEASRAVGGGADLVPAARARPRPADVPAGGAIHGRLRSNVRW